MKTTFFFVMAILALLPAARAQVAPDPVYWANLNRMNYTKFGLPQLQIRVGYFGELYGPNLVKMDDNHQYDERGTRLREPINMNHSFAINTRLTDRANLLIAPKFNTPLGDRSELRETDDQESVQMDDWVVGASYNWMNTEKWSYDTRLSNRLPTSIKSKNDGVDSQIELRQGLSYRARSELTLTARYTTRYYLYDADAEQERYRHNFTTFANYIITDKWNAQVMHEYEQQHRAPTTSTRQRRFNHTAKYKDQLAFGLGRNIGRNLNLMPYLRTLDNANIRPDTIQMGVWVSATVF